jgi:hypothetical protein
LAPAEHAVGQACTLIRRFPGHDNGGDHRGKTAGSFPFIPLGRVLRPREFLATGHRQKPVAGKTLFSPRTTMSLHATAQATATLAQVSVWLEPN